MHSKTLEAAPLNNYFFMVASFSFALSPLRHAYTIQREIVLDLPLHSNYTSLANKAKAKTSDGAISDKHAEILWRQLGLSDELLFSKDELIYGIFLHLVAMEFLANNPNSEGVSFYNLRETIKNNSQLCYSAYEKITKNCLVDKGCEPNSENNIKKKYVCLMGIIQYLGKSDTNSMPYLSGGGQRRASPIELHIEKSLLVGAGDIYKQIYKALQGVPGMGKNLERWESEGLLKNLSREIMEIFNSHGLTYCEITQDTIIKWLELTDEYNEEWATAMVDWPMPQR